MKILVTGENSYAGKQFYKRIKDLNNGWIVDFISVRDNSWVQVDFSVYETIYHVAAIVHLKEKSKMEEIYYEINRDLTFDLAKKAEIDGVKSFIYLSTIAVYGLIGVIGKNVEISRTTKENPKTFYGKSKLDGETLLSTLQSEDFKITILRIPMIYGPNCPGNYNALSKIAKITPVFPLLNNKKSLIYIDHLSDIVIFFIENKLAGTFLVSNPNEINTVKMVQTIAGNYHKKIHYSTFLGLLIRVFGNWSLTFRKIFGNLTYEREDTIIPGFSFTDISFEETIIQTENDSKFSIYFEERKK